MKQYHGVAIVKASKRGAKKNHHGEEAAKKLEKKKKHENTTLPRRIYTGTLPLYACLRGLPHISDIVHQRR